MHYKYSPVGICSREIIFDYDGEKITNLRFIGGCNGNLKAIGRLLEGMEPQYIIDKLKGNTCGHRPTSCADQLANAMEALLDGSLQPAD